MIKFGLDISTLVQKLSATRGARQVNVLRDLINDCDQIHSTADHDLNH